MAGLCVAKREKGISSGGTSEKKGVVERIGVCLRTIKRPAP